MRHRLIALFCIFSLLPAAAQWKLQKSPTSADLCATHTLDGKIAWASGAEGTVIRTEDGGENWHVCSVPKSTASVTITGVQALDATTSIVMTSGKGELSRLFKTIDGCKTWKLVFTNPDAAGSFVAVRRVSEHQLYLLGQPVDGKFAIFSSRDGGDTWYATDDPGLNAAQGETALAASNSDLSAAASLLFFGAQSDKSTSVFYTYPTCESGASNGLCAMAWGKATVASGTATPIASVAARIGMSSSGKLSVRAVAVGGDAKTEGVGTALAVFSTDGGKSWQPADSMPKGYRSAVGFDLTTRTWIAVGKGGSDVSANDGKTWTPVSGSSDGDWTAVSPPFAVGLHGKIGILNVTETTK